MYRFTDLRVGDETAKKRYLVKWCDSQGVEFKGYCHFINGWRSVSSRGKSCVPWLVVREVGKIVDERHRMSVEQYRYASNG